MENTALTPETSEAQATDNSSFNQETWELVAVGDWLAGQRFRISRHTVLGRDSGCDITIPGTHLSRRHAELAVKGSTLLIRDLKSSNGTYVNDKRVTETSLKPGDTVRFDVLTFRVHGPSPDNTGDTKATLIRRVENNHTPSGNRPAPVEKKWKTKPTAVGNRDKTVHITAVQKATHSMWSIMAILLSLATLVGIGFLITYI